MILLDVTEYDLRFVFQPAIFSLNNIKKAVYKLCNFGVFEIRETEVEIIVYFKSVEALSSDSSRGFETRFHAEVIDQNLREIVRRETENVRLLILANAFSKTSLVENNEGTQ